MNIAAPVPSVLITIPAPPSNTSPSAPASVATQAVPLAMLAVGLAMLRPAKAEGDPAVRLDLPMTLKLVPAGLVVGLAAGFFGIGGGFLIVPALMAATGMTLANAAASSLVSVVLRDDGLALPASAQ